MVAPVVLKLLIGKKVPFNFHLTQNNGESTLRVDFVTREGKISSDYKCKWRLHRKRSFNCHRS
ncbi:MAG: hypothetical protein ACFFB8_18805 [Promethearchaeota archaeon]